MSAVHVAMRRGASNDAQDSRIDAVDLRTPWHQPARRCDVVTEHSNVQRRCSHLAYPHTHFIILAFSIAASEFFISCFLYSSMVSGGSLRLRSSTLRSLTSHNWSATCEINRKS